MTGPIRHVQAARGYLARFVVVIGVLTGLVLAHGVQCPEGMTAMAIEHAASSGMTVGAAQDGPAAVAAVATHFPDEARAADAGRQATARYVVVGAAAVSALTGNGPVDSHGLGGGLAACLAFIVAALAVIVVLRAAWLRILVSVLMSGHGPRTIRVVHPRAPSLTELCLLRT